MPTRNDITHCPVSAANSSPLRKKTCLTVARGLLVCLLAGLISACTTGKEYQRPHVDVPTGWRVDYEAAAGLANTAWWEQFRDPVLDELIKTALNENMDLRIAAARVEEFAGRLQATRSGFYPQIDYGINGGRNQRSLDRITFLPVSGERAQDTYQVSSSVAWELDIWGRLRRATEAARAELLAAEESRQAVLLTLVSSVATGYLELLSMDRQLAIARQAAASREEFLKLFERKFEGGQISGLELAQARAAYEQIASSIPVLERQIAIQENSLSLLLGRNPGGINRGRTLDTLVLPGIPQGLPSELLERRPDIRYKEQLLIAANARIGEVKSRYFPSLSLTGLFGYASGELSDLLQSSANFWRVAAGAIGPLFTGGRIKGEVRQAEAQHQELLYGYLGTIQTAFREVEDSLVSIRKLRELLDREKRRVSTLKDKAKLAYNRYDAKYSGYLEVVDAERDLYSAEISYVQAQHDLFAAIVSNYKAMGGGWMAEAAQRR
ncbi:MAG: efflux transporter outer membrane subunit [Alphaproteobacteria bacterium]|uniref:Efflux transporter outer membrane subunit n=1 Tax=Candidatus Nitrobium versatile TaxID=2884831 RepID=A0A953JC83_9BACT|nr:efflux transporter outer membrane subunit [Candidatus Nitrobium versatile]